MADKKTTKKTAKKAPKKRNNTKELKETHGKVEDGKPTTLDQIWGDTGLWKYNTMDLNQYKNNLKEMNKTDLQAHAKKIGLIPLDDRTMLMNRLEKEFKTHVSQYKTISKKSEKPGDVSDEVIKILSEGR